MLIFLKKTYALHACGSVATTTVSNDIAMELLFRYKLRRLFLRKFLGLATLIIPLFYTQFISKQAYPCNSRVSLMIYSVGRRVLKKFTYFKCPHPRHRRSCKREKFAVSIHSLTYVIINVLCNSL